MRAKLPRNRHAVAAKFRKAGAMKDRKKERARRACRCKIQEGER